MEGISSKSGRRDRRRRVSVNRRRSMGSDWRRIIKEEADAEERERKQKGGKGEREGWRRRRKRLRREAWGHKEGKGRKGSGGEKI